MQLDYVSISEDGDYYQVWFDEKNPNGTENDTGGKCLIIQRQFEMPDGGKIYVETHDLSCIGHFKVVLARLTPTSLSLTLQGKPQTLIEVSFHISIRKYRHLKRVMKIMIPKIEIEDEEKIYWRGQG